MLFRERYSTRISILAVAEASVTFFSILSTAAFSLRQLPAVRLSLELSERNVSPVQARRAGTLLIRFKDAEFRQNCRQARKFGVQCDLKRPSNPSDII
jgi:hypothetical protein